MPPIAPKKRLRLALSIRHPKPRAAERAELLDRALRRSRQVRLDLGRGGRRKHGADFLLGAEDFAQGGGEVFRLGDVHLAVPHGVEAGEEGGFEGWCRVGFFDMG